MAPAERCSPACIGNVSRRSQDDDRSSTDASPGSRCLPASRPLPVRAARRNLSFYAQLREPAARPPLGARCSRLLLLLHRGGAGSECTATHGAHLEAAELTSAERVAKAAVKRGGWQESEEGARTPTARPTGCTGWQPTDAHSPRGARLAEAPASWHSLPGLSAVHH
ncbi:unnamed protein product [Lampetra planeri]